MTGIFSKLLTVKIWSKTVKLQEKTANVHEKQGKV